MPFPTPNDCQRRIIQLSQEWAVDLPPATAPLARPQNSPSFWTPKDDEIAEGLMQRRASELSQLRRQSTLSKAFSSNNLKKGKTWDPHEVLEVLSVWIANSGSPGVAEALISKLSAAGVVLSGNQTKQKSSILNRKKSVDTFVNRSKFLKLAVEGNQYDMLQVLLPHADGFSIDQALAPAIRSGNIRIAELLLKYGARASQTPEGQDAFRQACAVQSQAHMIGLLLRSESRPNTAWISACMCDAARSACLGTVLHLSRSTADGNHNEAQALKSAIALGRQDIALAIIMGNIPPYGPGLDEAFQMLYQHPSIIPATKLAMAELLLCAGAQGDVLSQALESACETQFYDMANLLSRYGASIEYKDAIVLKTAIARGELDLVTSLLTDSAKLSPALASSCVPLIAKHAPFETRATVLGLLLRKGANGTALDDMLIDAAEAGDLKSAGLLLNPVDPETAPVTPDDSDYTRLSNGRPHHSAASVDHQSGQALRTAVLRADAPMTDKILSVQPTAETLSIVFPMTKKLSPKDRYRIAQLFLKRPLPGPFLHAALHDAISEDASQRDNSFIKLLLEHNADINFGHGSGLAALIKQKDISLLGSLLQKASPQTAASRVMDVTEVSDHRERFEMTSMLIDAGAAIGTQQIATALLQTLCEKPVDMSLLRLLLQKGGADVNLLEGAIAKTAVSNPDPKVLDMVFAYSRPSAATVTCAFNELAPLPPTDTKAWKLRAILSKSKQKEDLSRALVHEVHLLLQMNNDKASLSTLKILLDSGADPNACEAAALCHAIAGANVKISDMVLESKTPPSAAALGAALPHALRITDPMKRLTLTKQLVNAGAHPLEVNRALIHAITIYPKDASLQNTLVAAADTSNGEALSLSISKELPETMDLLLSKSQSSLETRSIMLAKAMKAKNQTARHDMCKGLLTLGVSTATASSALLVAARDGDVKLGDLLMSHGASIATNNGQAIVEACRGGSADVLSVLLKQDGPVEKSTLDAAFQAATELGDLGKRAVVLEQLLKKDLSGDLVDAQLQPAARYGEDGQALLRVLLIAGADPNFDNGMFLIMTLPLLTVSQKKASQATLSRSLKACWNLGRDSRFKVVNNLVNAGLQPTDDMHIALNEAINEDDPEDRLVRLLLNHGASPAANGYKTFVDAAKNSASSSLALLLEKNLPQEDIGRAFNHAFTSETFAKWFTDRGYETAKILLDKGAHGESLSVALVLVMKNSSVDTEILANHFVTLLIKHGADVNYHDGEPLQQAASKANVSWTKQLLECRPTIATLSLAFQCIFDTALSQDHVLELFKMFAEYSDEDVRIDVSGWQHGSEPVLKRVSTSVIELLLARGAKVNAETSLSRTTPLMLAIQTRRPDLAKILLLQGAEVDSLDYLGRTPLSMATDMGGHISAQILPLLLAADPARDDGSLHNAARDLNLPAVKILVQSGHDPDFPSPLHEGRSALAELCLHGSDKGEMSADHERTMQKVMTFLIDNKSDLSIKANDMTLLQLCFEASDPVVTTRCFLKSGMWKLINKPFNFYTREGYTYSPTMYIKKFLPQTDLSDTLLKILKANRANDVYYAISGAQPPDAVGLPEDMAVQERARKARLERLAEETEDFSASMARKREIASVEQQILAQKAEMEDLRRRKLHNEDVAAVRSRAQLEESLASAAHTRRLQEHHSLAESSISHSRALAASELEAEEARQRKALEWETRLNTERVNNARAQSSIRISERQEVEKIDKSADVRIKGRLEAQKKLVESQEKLAKRLADGPGGSINDPRRQIGYVTELN
ncbi:ankyrin repeat containing protein [Metarhizium album ARSEF 1941]|uniref:Ankyrin repeat containing protein n=1 Tax=Metarhizium album (strain ARSEF 1941) TaxID=1081103 RepID=A0A0B2WYF5_METAS|nr:ankyrin repeat containing protein [Metarhizium album ARSEF 1941]KHN98457.1 ankyrin repeat containing protein [Metarhizium album ARSEF 1941]